MRTKLYRYRSEIIPDTAGNISCDVVWHARQRRSLWDTKRVGRIYNDGSSPFNLIFAGNTPGSTYPFQQVLGEGDLTRNRMARLAARRQLLNALQGTQNVTILLPNNTDLLFFTREAPPSERRRRGWEKKWAAYRKASVPQTDTTLPLSAPWAVYQVKVQDILNEIQFHLLEPVQDGGLTWQFWTFEEVFNYLRERVSRWLLETRLIKDKTTLTLVADQSTYNLDPILTDLYRVYNPEAGVVSRVDEWQQDFTDSTWEGNTGSVTSVNRYIEDQFDPLTLRAIPTPTGSGNLTYHYVKQTPLEDAGDVVVEATTDFILFPLRLPSTFSWGIKYGVMADMLSRQGEGNDPQRAAYCEQRYRDSVDLGRLMNGETPGESN